MPKLLIFAPCERVILGQGDNSVSLIVIIQQMQFRLPAGQPIPAGAGAIARFSIFSQWYKLPNDRDKFFEQRIVLSIGSENPILDAVTEFQMPERLHRLTANVPILPVMNPGDYTFKLFVREKGAAQWGDAVADYPFEVVHINEMQPQ